MRQIQLTNEVVDQAKQRAVEAGFENVNDFIATLLNDYDDFCLETPNLDQLFTPERLAIIDKSLAEVRAGARTFSMAEAREHLAQSRENWT
jgi:hypothetical protein